MAGLALATSLSALICTFLLFYSLRKKIGNFGQEKILTTAIKSLLSAILMGVCVTFAHAFIMNHTGTGFIGQAISILGSVLAGDNSVWNICDNSKNRRSIYDN